MNIDHFIQHWINREHVSPFFDEFMARITNFPAWRPVFLLGLLLSLIFGNFRLRMMILCLVVAVGFNDGILVNGIKHLAGRPRPLQVEPGVRTVNLAQKSPEILALAVPAKVNFPEVAPPGSHVAGHSFPSGHSSNAMTAAMIIFLFYRKRGGLLCLLLGLTISYSRVYVGAHWPTDVLTGIIIGLLNGSMFAYLFNAAWKRWGTRISPILATAHPCFF